jgi:hypothetical protein
LAPGFSFLILKKIDIAEVMSFLWKKKLAKKNLIFKLFSIKNHHIKKHYVTFES